jgi:hypothetical protein
MIQLFIENVPADMGNATATIRKGGGLLDFKGLDPTISIPMQLPYTDHNRRLFGHAERPASVADLGIYPSHIEYDGLVIEEGKFLLLALSLLSDVNICRPQCHQFIMAVVSKKHLFLSRLTKRIHNADND